MKRLLGVVVVVGIVAVKLLVKIGIGVGVSAGVAEADIVASKFEPWPAQFRNEVVTGCVESAEGVPAAAEYCKCYAGLLEAQHIIPTKYNSLTTTEQQYSEQVGKIVDEFLESPVGKSGIENCLASARSKGT